MNCIKIKENAWVYFSLIINELDFMHWDNRGKAYNYVEDCDPVQVNINIFAVCITIATYCARLKLYCAGLSEKLVFKNLKLNQFLSSVSLLGSQGKVL